MSDLANACGIFAGVGVITALVRFGMIVAGF